jgi:hypothetical protein
MSSDPGKSTGGPWQSNGTYPAQDGTGPETPDLENDRPENLPTPEERISGLLDGHPDKMLTPISTDHGRKLREEALEEPEEVTREVEIGETETRRVSETVSRGALPLVAVMEEFLEWYEGYRDKYLKMAKGDGFREGRKEFLVELDNSFQPSYQKQTYARLQALRRQTAGGEYPDGSECAGAFEEPVTVLFGLTASGVGSDGTPRPIVDHAREVREAWIGSASSTKRTLRYVLEDKLGLTSDEYAWWYQSEPHPGDGANAGYTHAHPVVVLDRAAASVESVEAEDFRAVVAKHVAECDGAEWSAHDLDESVKIKKPGEIEDFAQYVAEYVAVSPDQDLLQRSDEYLMYAAANWASTSQKYSKSGTATAAIEADKCHQRCADPDARQEADHGAEVTHTDGETVCWHCGESFGVDQQETLTERRVATDGGTQTADPDARQEADSGGLRSAWPDARAAGRVGGETVERECGHPEASDTCPLCASETEAPDHTVSGEVPIPDGATAPESPDLSVESVGRGPAQWEPVAIVDKAPEEPEETLIGSPGGSPFGEVVVAGVESVGGKVDRSHLQPEWLRGPEPWASSPLTEEEVRSGEVPPPELVAREYAERHSGDMVTAKEWSSDWYADRYERDGDGQQETHGLEEEPVRQYARTHPEASVIEVLGHFGLGAERREFVEELVASE